MESNRKKWGKPTKPFPNIITFKYFPCLNLYKKNFKITDLDL